MTGQSDSESAGRYCVLGERTVYDGTEFQVGQLDLVLPDGDELPWDVVRLARSAWLVLADPGGRVLLVRRYRPACDRWGWELPGGPVEAGEDPSETAARELAEETGYRAGEMELVLSFQPEPRSADGENLIFAGQDPELIQDAIPPGDAVVSQWAEAGSVLELIAAGEIWSAGTLTGLLRQVSLNSRPARTH